MKKTLISISIILIAGVAGMAAFDSTNFRTPAAVESGKNQNARVISDYWYTITVSGDVPYGYYRDRFEKSGDQIQFFNELWKKEEGYINTESLGAVAKHDDRLTPLFFNYRSVYRSTETVADGQIKDGKLLEVKVKRGDEELPLIRKAIGGNVFFSSHFPYRLGRELSSLKPKQTRAIHAILEDNIDGDYDLGTGVYWLKEQDEYSKKTETFPVHVRFHNYESTWYVDKNGFAMKVEIPQRSIVIERVPEAQAKKFLSE